MKRRINLLSWIGLFFVGLLLALASLASGDKSWTVSCDGLIGDLTTGLDHWWKFDETSGLTATDSAGSAPGTLVNSPDWAPNEGQVDGAIYLDGIIDYVTTGASPLPAIPTGDFTYSAWVKYANGTVQTTIFSARNATPGDELDWMFDPTSVGQLSLWLDDGAIIIAAGAAPPTAGWHLVTLTRVGGTVSTYIDGGLASTAFQPNTLSFGTCPILIGTEADLTCNSSLGNYFAGYLDDLRIYSRGLSANDVALLYNTYKIPTSHSAANDLTSGLVLHYAFDETSGTTADDTGSANSDATLATGATFTTSGCHSGAACLSLDGVAGYAVSGASPGLPTGDFTYAAWIKRPVVNTSDAIFAALVSTASTQNELNIFFGNANDNILSVVANDTTLQMSTGKVGAGTTAWTHIAVTKKAGFMTSYVNGQPAQQVRDTSTLNFGTCGLVIGMDPDAAGAAPCVTTPSDFFGGLIDDVRVYSRALNWDEIKALAAL